MMMNMTNRTSADISKNTSVAVMGLNDIVITPMKREQLMPFPVMLDSLDT